MLVTHECDGYRVTVVVRYDVEERLKTTCFRGGVNRLAGNFFRWNDIKEFFRDKFIIQELADEVADAFENSAPGNLSAEIEYKDFVGWDSTNKMSNFSHEQLEWFRPNRRSRALRVRPELADVLAPKTKKITFVYELKREAGQPTAVIWSIYPGEDVGELNGDITEREKVVFYDWNHLGE